MSPGYSTFAVIAFSVYLITGWQQVLGKQKNRCEDGYKCGAGQECYMKEINCEYPPCPTTPSCTYSCDGVRCRSGYVCKDGNCVKEPFDKCALVLCEVGTYCIDGICYKEPTCENQTCNVGEECFLEDVQCFVAPCPPIPSCRPIDKCALIDCRSGYKCVKGECIVETTTCEGQKCGPGEECYLQDVQCVKAPCLPVPACRPILTCATINCLRGYICIDNKCIPEPTCDGFKCEPGMECYIQRIKCLKAPCPPPRPACKPSCAAIQCLAPSNCVNGECIPL